MRYDLVIFDLDGTVLNTLEDLHCALNHALSAAGFAPRTMDETRRFIGNGIGNLIRRAVPEGTDEARAQAILAEFKTYYMAHVNDHTMPYPGIPALLRALRAAGVKTAVNSNKVDEAVQSLCRSHFDGLLDAALGEREGTPRKPAPDGALSLLQALGVARECALYVGDGEADIQTALNAGMDGAWVSWGYRREEELGGLTPGHRFDSVEALQRWLLEA